MLKIENVCKNYPSFSLNHINFQVPAGCIMGFIGENGAGKSTTIKLILDLIQKDSGMIEVLGQDSTKISRDMKEHIGVVLDEANFSQELNYKDINKIMKHLYKTWDSHKFMQMMKEGAIPPDRKFKDYSKGMKMKLSIAAAVCHDTWLLIMDEATSGLDPVSREEVLDFLLEFIQDERHAVFISSHILSDLEKVCDYITLIHKGSIIFSEVKDELIEKYGILKCGKDELADIDAGAIIGMRENAFGIEALVLKNRIPEGFVVDLATLDEIMLFYVKGEK